MRVCSLTPCTWPCCKGRECLLTRGPVSTQFSLRQTSLVPLCLLLLCSREKWEEARDHAMRAVVGDSRMRAWYADRRATDIGLLFACRLGRCERAGAERGGSKAQYASGRAVWQPRITKQRILHLLLRQEATDLTLCFAVQCGVGPACGPAHNAAAA